MYGKSLVLNRVVNLSYIPWRTKKDSTKRLLEFLANMPKANSSRIEAAQRQRIQISKKSEKYGPSTVYLQVLGSGAEGAPNTLYMFTDQKRYMFNCGECTQRLAHEHKVKLSRLDHIFITSKTWRNIGGLPGLSLTLQDVGVPNIMLHGPEGLDELYNATKRFVIMKDMNVTMAKCDPSTDFEDNVMTVKYVLLGCHESLFKELGKNKPVAKKPKMEHEDKELEQYAKDDTDYYKHDAHTSLPSPTKKTYVKPRVKSPDLKTADREAKKTTQVLHDLQKVTRASVAYICTLKKRLGTLNLEKCVELGVKPGPMLGQLKNGHDVVLSDGTLVLAKDVKTPDDPGPVFIVLDVPEISYLNKSEFSAHFDDGVNPPEKIPTLIVHFTPPHVFHNPAYQQFMKQFGPCTRHLILNSQNSCLGSEAVHRTQHKLHLLDPDIFPLLRDASIQAVWNAQQPLPKTNSPIRLKGLEELKNKIALAQFQNIINMEGSCKGDCKPPGIIIDDESDKLEIIAGRTLTMFHLRPKKQLDRSAEPKLHIQEYIKETMDVDGFVQSLEQFRRLVDSMRYARSGTAKEYPKVVFLGTGSCIPSKTRNTSAIVIQADEDKAILLDCGEGTYAQLVRFYGPKKVNAFLRTLQAIYISHLHADHHIGLIGVLQARRQAFEEIDDLKSPDPVYLLAPGQIMSWLTLYDNQFDRIRQEFTLVPNQNLLTDAEPKPVMPLAMLNQIGVEEIETCLVSHCPNAFGVSIQLQRHKITYSGDTIPCEALVKCGQNSTLLIHEATMEDELAEEARIKMHSTTTQAIDVGKQMNARYTLLTHFSQRYARLPRLNPNILNDNNSVGIAFDNMQISMNDLELLPHMYAPLQLMFAEHCVEMELKAAQRARQKERRSTSPMQTPEARMRRQSPGCRSNVTYLTLSSGNYRESHASRLRQEIKGMTISGSLTTSPTPRSPKPRSPSKTRTRISSSSSPRESKTLTNGKLFLLPEPLEELSSDQLNVIAPARTISESSEVCSVKDDNRILKSPQAQLAAPMSSCHIDTRSKTLNSESGGSRQSITKSRTAEQRKYQPPKIEHSNSNFHGYGKPLVTPVNKRLSLRRDMPARAPRSMLSERVSPVVTRRRSPARISLKAENRRCNTAPTADKRDLSKSKIPTAKRPGSGNVLHGNTSVVKSEKSPVSRSSAAVKGLKGSTSNSVQGHISTSPARPHTRTQSGPSSRPSTASSIDSKPAVEKSWNASTKISPPPYDNKNKNVSAKTPRAQSAKEFRTCPKNSSNSESSVSSNSSRPSSIPRMSQLKQPTKFTIKAKSEDSNTLSSQDQLNTESTNSMPSFREKLNETIMKQKQEDSKKEVKKDGRPNSANHSVRSFKPQLEDIKSSFILLNKKLKESNDKLPPVSKPKPIDENRRQKQLEEIKKKLTGPKYHHDSKYDKIEGLNWISWK